jgi:3-hydroxyacyl-CoA dehydrogenase
LWWGFNWELGPFEQARAIDHPRTSDVIPAVVSGNDRRKPLSSNPGADITDLGDGVLACEFHTKMNAIDGDVIAQLGQALDMAEKNGTGLVICNNGQNFSAGANLMMLFLAAQSGAWDQIDAMVKGFQGAAQRIRFCKRPVVAAPFGLTLGGGCEVSIAACCINASAETYMGLVELGVGLIPAGGGCKNMLLRMEERHKAMFDTKNMIWMAPDDGGPFPKVRDAFQTIAFARVSTSAKEARKIGYMGASDRITLDREKLFGDAKKAALELAKNYQPPKYRNDITLPGEGGKMALVNGIRQSHLKGDVTEFETVLGEKLAHVLTGGDRPAAHKADEQHILDLEREAFLSLCGMPKTLERIQHMLSAGKPLRN